MNLEERKVAALETIATCLCRIVNNPQQAYIKVLSKFQEVQDARNIRVEDCTPNTRIRNCMLNNDIETLGDLSELSEERLKTFRSLGQKSIEEIKYILNQHGLVLAIN